MKREDFKGIGGSDIAAVMGLSRWKTPLQLYGERVGLLQPKDLSQNEAVELGTELEDFVAKKFERKTGMKVRRAPKRYTHATYDWAQCQVDRLITDSEELLECKTASARNEKEWEGEEIPQEYILQVNWQLGITGRKKGWIAVLIGGQKFRYKCIDFNAKLFQTQMDAAIKFMQMVQDRTPPMAMLGDSDALLTLHPNSSSELQTVETLNEVVRHLQETKMHIAQMKEEQETLELKLKEVIGDNLGIKTSEYVVKWTPQVSRRVDNEKLKADGVYDKYLTDSATRVLRVTKTKEKDNGK